MEELNKNQVVLLTLLVSFVTSIATGIVTVTLLEQSPPAVTQTINRVVERTIEKVVPGETKTTTVIKEVPVVVTEEKLIVDVINAASPGVVRLTDRAGNSLGSAFVVGESGLLAADNSVLSLVQPAGGETPPPAPIELVGFLADGKGFVVRPVEATADVGVVLLRLDLTAPVGLADGGTPPSGTTSTPVETLMVLELGAENVLPGQTVVALGRPDAGPITVAGGIISGLFTNASSTEFIRSNAVNTSNVGGPLLNLKGKVIGLNREPGLAVSAAMIKQTLDTVAP